MKPSDSNDPAGCRARRCGRAFSLVEVVIALGVFAIAVMSVLGLLAPSVRSASDVADTDVAARLASDVQVELQRAGYANVLAALGNSSTTRLFLVATRNGERVLPTAGTIANPDGTPAVVGPPPIDYTVAANRPLDDTTLPGIAHRDRYFLVELWRESSTLSASDPPLGYLRLHMRILWPWRIPSGAESPLTGGKAVNADASTRLDEAGTTPAADLSRRSYTDFSLALPR